MVSNSRLKIFAGSSDHGLAEGIAKHLGTKLGIAELGRFADNDTRINILESVRECDVFVVQSTCNPANERIMELLIFIDALKRASAKRINAVIPWYGYARQDHKSAPREPVSAKLIANLLTTAGADRVVSIDLHSGAIQGFFDIPVDNLTALAILCDRVKELGLHKNSVVVAPDAGGVKRAKKFADALKTGLAFINKFRPEPNVAVAMSLVGEVKGKDAIIIDDMVDTAGSVCAAADALKKNGARGIYVCTTHAPLSGPAIERIEKSNISKVFVTDTIPQKGNGCSKIEVLSVAPLLAEVIRRIHEGESVSAPLAGLQTAIDTFL